jgi:hypothetical protein
MIPKAQKAHKKCWCIKNKHTVIASDETHADPLLARTIALLLM